MDDRLSPPSKDEALKPDPPLNGLGAGRRARIITTQSWIPSSEIDVARHDPGLEEVDRYLAHHRHPRAALAKQPPNDVPQSDQHMAADNEESEPQFDRERELSPCALIVASHV